MSGPGCLRYAEAIAAGVLFECIDDKARKKFQMKPEKGYHVLNNPLRPMIAPDERFVDFRVNQKPVFLRMPVRVSVHFFPAITAKLR